MQKEPIATGLRIIPMFPINLSVADKDFPSGSFGVYSDLESIGRQDFLDGRATFAYIPAGQDETP